MTKQILLLLIAWLVLEGGAGAQNPQPGPPQQTQPLLAPPGSAQPPPERIAPERPMPRHPGDSTLSDRLSRQEGTLDPPAVDPGIHAPVRGPSNGTMRVIPPPGSPGGDQIVEPK
jgi:hypothetical protein